MDSSNQQDNSPDAIRERVESKSDEFAGGASPGWQTLEATVDDSRHEAAQQWNDAGGGTTTATAAPETATGQTSGDTQTETVRGVESPDEMPPFNAEHPLGVGQQCYKCGAYNDLEAESCWNCGETLTHSMAETPGGVNDQTVETVSTDETTDSDGGASPISQT